MKYSTVPIRLPAAMSLKPILAGTACRITSSDSMTAGEMTMPTSAAGSPAVLISPLAPRSTSSPPTVMTARPPMVRPVAPHQVCYQPRGSPVTAISSRSVAADAR